MNKRKLFSTLSILCIMTLMLGLAVIFFSPEAVAAYGSIETKHITSDGNSNQFTTPLSATYSIPDSNNAVVALVMQPGQDEIHAFNALTGDWVALGGIDFKVEADDVAMVSNIAILVAQPGQDKLHAYSALTGEWATLEGAGFRVERDDILKVKDTVIVVSQPGQEKFHAYSALTGEWATLSGANFRVAPDDIVLVGPEN